MNKKLIIPAAILASVLVFSCGGRGEGSKSHGCSRDATATSATVNPKTEAPVTYNFYVENSGSVRGYFKNSDDARNILKQFYDRIDESKADQDTFTVNYINNTVQKEKLAFDDWLHTIGDSCNAAYSDLDKVLTQVLDKTNKQSVNFVLSDYCFESKDGNIQAAQSQITKIFTKGLKKYSDLAIAIYKYEASFDGKYYPGGIPFVGKRPLYLWIFGPTKEIKRISGLHISTIEEAKLFLQRTGDTCQVEVQAKHARMTDKQHKVIHVDKWDKARGNRQKDLYEVDVNVNLAKILLGTNEILDKRQYTVTPSEFVIEKIEKADDQGNYWFTIATEKPYPCNLVIERKVNFPAWVNASSCDTNALPPKGATYGIKYLIQGVFDAYCNNSDNLFVFKIEII